MTEGAIGTAVLTWALWLSHAFTAIWVAAPAVAVAVKITGLPARPAEVAVSVSVPATVPSVHEPTVATPLPFVVWLPPVTLPLPAAGANVTATPATALPN